MFSRSSMGKLTGWKALLALIPILVIIGFKAFNATPQYRQFLSESINVPQGESGIFDFELPQSGKIQINIADTSQGEYWLCLMTEESMNDLQEILASGTGSVADISTLLDSHYTGNQTITDISLHSGHYYLLIEGTTESGITCKVTLSVYR
ncbi:MAG: hypothetical protein JW936_08775 [Sedimentisphaerales bacterium]|nr:hypothetical protein [Sedimentisphaerales bacterium]